VAAVSSKAHRPRCDPVVSRATSGRALACSEARADRDRRHFWSAYASASWLRSGVGEAASMTVAWPAWCPLNAVCRFRQVADGGAASIDHYPLHAGAMEIELSQVPPPLEKWSAGSMDSSANVGGKFRLIPYRDLRRVSRSCSVGVGLVLLAEYAPLFRAAGLSGHQNGSVARWRWWWSSGRGHGARGVRYVPVRRRPWSGYRW